MGIHTILIQLSRLWLRIHTCKENWGILLSNSEAFLLDL